MQGLREGYILDLDMPLWRMQSFSEIVDLYGSSLKERCPIGDKYILRAMPFCDDGTASFRTSRRLS